MIIDMFAHILTPKFLSVLNGINPKPHVNVERLFPAVGNLDIRFRLMERYPEVLEVITISQPPLEEIVPVDKGIELAKIANEELAELIIKYPDKFIAAAACVTLDDMDAALVEIDRAIKDLGLKGVQIFTSVHGKYPDDPEFRPLFQKMAEYDMPIWIHPNLSAGRGLETSTVMERLVSSGVFHDYPNLKIIVHHCGGGLPFFHHRMSLPSGLNFGRRSDYVESLQKFYADTATIGTTALMCGYEFFGPDHLLFASDSPLGGRFGQTIDGIQQVQAMNISDGDKEKIFWRNALKLLKIAV